VGALNRDGEEEALVQGRKGQKLLIEGNVSNSATAYRFLTLTATGVHSRQFPSPCLAGKFCSQPEPGQLRI
jgi:hypothetical protein